MIRKQVLQQFVFLLVAATWPTPDDPSDPLFGLTGEVVFPPGSVVISTQPPESFVGTLNHPFAVVRPYAAPVDREATARVDNGRFTITVVGRGAGDRYGQSPVIGGNSTSQAQSPGRGVEEVLEVVATALGTVAQPGQLVDSTHAMQGYVDRVNEAYPLTDSPELAAVDVDVVVTNEGLQRFYHAPRRLTAVGVASQPYSYTFVTSANLAPYTLTVTTNSASVGYTAGPEAVLSPSNTNDQNAAALAANVNTQAPLMGLLTAVAVGPVVTFTLTGALTLVLAVNNGGGTPGAVTFTNAAAPSVTLSWTNPPARYDAVGRVIVRKAGSTPPTKADGTDGTVLSTTALGATTYVDAPGSGTWSYGVFNGLDERRTPPTTPGRWSSPATVTLTV